ncbi:MAG: sulfite exporter TauE/SafE family protein [Candidatus Brocadiales bacterium]
MDTTLELVFNLKLLFGAVVGLTIGTLAGITGMPLGALRLPAVYLIVPTPHIAAGTNLGVDTLTATTASYRYWKARLVDITVLLFMGGFSCIGSFLGGYSSKYVSYKWLLVFIGLVYFCVGVDMLRSATSRKSEAGQSHEGKPEGEKSDEGWRGESCSQRMEGRGVVIAALWGFILGFIGGMAGLLMGSLRVPTMIKAMGLAPAAAAGTNMVISLFMAVSGFLGHLLHRNLDLSVLLTMGIASMIGSYAGSQLGVTLSPTATKRLIGVAITMMAIVLFFNGVRM